jgi:O-antigen/teichoic acid export membrane protein
VVSWIVGAATAIGAVAAGARYGALIALPMTVSIIQMVLSWSMLNWRPGLPRRGGNVRSMVAFGGHVMVSSLIAQIGRNADNILIGKYWGPAALGLYSRAYSLLMIPLQQINAPLAAIAVPAFSRISNQQERYARGYLGAMNAMVWVFGPIVGVVTVGAEPLIRLLLGPRWCEAAGIFQLLAISALTQPIYNSLGWLLVSCGRPQRLVKLGLWMCPLVVGAFAFGLPFGPKGVAMSYSTVLFAALPWALRFAFRDTQLTLRRLGRAVMGPIGTCLVAVISAGLVVHVVKPGSSLLALLIMAGTFAAVYAGAPCIPPLRAELRFLREAVCEALSTRNVAPRTTASPDS